MPPIPLQDDGSSGERGFTRFWRDSGGSRNRPALPTRRGASGALSSRRRLRAPVPERVWEDLAAGLAAPVDSRGVKPEARCQPIPPNCTRQPAFAKGLTARTSPAWRLSISDSRTATTAIDSPNALKTSRTHPCSPSPG